MKRLVVDANIAFAVGKFGGTLRSSGSVLDVHLTSFSDLRGLRRSAGLLDGGSPTLLHWCKANHLSLRILVNDRVVAESGDRLDDVSGFQIPWGTHWRIRPIDLLKVFFKR